MSIPTLLFIILLPLKITFLDVKEGDSTVIESPTGEIIVVDSGNLISGGIVRRFLASKERTQFDALILTHPHPDHIGGVFTLLDHFRFNKIYDNAENLDLHGKDQDLYRWYKEIVRDQQTYRSLKKNDKLDFGELSLIVLSPSNPLTTTNWNTNSLVILLKYGMFRTLLMADADTTTELELLNNPNIENVHLLKAGHHGSSSTADLRFIEKIRPREVIVSVNSDNIRGYPSEQTLTRYRSLGAKVHRTDKSGQISINALKDGTYSFTNK